MWKHNKNLPQIYKV